MINKTSTKPIHSLSPALVLAAIAVFLPLRVEALSIDVATPEFLRGETRPKSVAVLPPQGVSQAFERYEGEYLAWVFKGKGYATKALTVDQVNADPQLQELVSRANHSFDVELGVLRHIMWLGTRKKKVSQRQVNLGADISLLASKLEVDGVVFGRASIASAGMGLRLLWIDVGVVNGKTGDLEAYYYEQVQSWSSPRDAMDRLTEEFSHNLPGATHAVKAKGSTLKASATDKKEKK